MSLKEPFSKLAKRFPLIAKIATEKQLTVWLTAAGALLIIYISVYLVALQQSDGIVFHDETLVGGDFIAFWTASRAAIEGAAVQFYQPENLPDAIAQMAPTMGNVNLFWQYPPTMYLILFPLGFLPFTVSFFTWATLNLGLFFLLIRKFWSNKIALFLALSSGAVFQAIITGQTGFLTAACIAIIATYAGSAPALAGMAAALLTVKPQLGLLIPVALAAGNYWRAFFWAAVASILFAGASALIFGIDSWFAAIQAISEHGARVSSSGFPHRKMVSVYGAMKMLAAPEVIALGTQIIASFVLVAVIFVIWRAKPHRDIRILSLCAATPIAAPYALYYELPAMVIAVFLLAKIGFTKGWLWGERALLPVLWVAPLLTLGGGSAPGAPMTALTAILALVLCLRRALYETGHLRAKTLPPSNSLSEPA